MTSRVHVRLVIAVCCLIALSAVGWAATSAKPTESVSLAGQWRFDLDPKNVGIKEGWFNKALSDAVKLPGSTDSNRKGIPNTRKPDLQHLSRLYEYTGAAWYQRDIFIPREWKNKRVVLFLERCHWETRVWLDGKECGMRDSLCVPHVHELGIGVTPGRHRLTIRTDNGMKYNVGGWAHSITEETQTNWNGVIGRIELRATPRVWIENVQVYPDAARKTARVVATLGGKTTSTVRLAIDIRLRGSDQFHYSSVWGRQRMDRTLVGTVSMQYGMRPWDEFSPALYDLTARLVVEGVRDGEPDEFRTSFGMRDLRVQDKRFVLNGRGIFLRGTLECCIFPRTGYPPTDVASWLRIFRICKSYGLNHMRFHSWCPPEAAFEAADRMGFLLHVEAPQWVGDVGKDAPRDSFIEAEMRRILDTYGNHPSFGMFCLGNELQGDSSFLQKMVLLGKELDGRHLYTPSTAWSHGENDDYRVAVIRGLHGPTTDVDFVDQVAKHPVPVISHEIGQWSVFPNLAETRKYTGVTRARNFDLIRGSLDANGLLDQAAAFTQASGKLSAQLYKEEIEVLLRTPDHGGFQLLDLHDFSGQGTSLVGILDPFWDSKGLITPREWSRFCGPIVPLLRMGKRTWTTAETFTARAQVAQFGPRDLPESKVSWTITFQDGHELASGDFPGKRLPTGDLHDLGEMSASLANVTAPAKLTVTVSVKGTDASNSWNIWVYPANADVSPPSDVLVTRSAEGAVSALNAGGKVLMLASRKSLARSGRGSFNPVFWSPILFGNESNKGLGILCDPKHPALTGFPTDFHQDWQWFDVVENSSNMVLDGTPKDFRPVVQVVDNFLKNRKLGNLIEARVGDGRLMVCSMNLDGNQDGRPAARQMLRSILDYMGSSAFRPKHELTLGHLHTFLRDDKPTALQLLGARIVEVDSEDPANPATNMMDGDPDTCWHTLWQDSQPPFPHEVRIDLGKAVGLAGLTYLPRQDMTNGWFTDYEFYVSQDGVNWGEPVVRGSFTADAEEKAVSFDKPHRGRFVRLVALKGIGNNPWCAIAELDFVLAQ